MLKSKTKYSKSSDYNRFNISILLSFLIVSVLIITGLYQGYQIIFSNVINSKGERSGLILMLMQRGLFFKTLEGEAVLFQPNGGTSYIWQFSVNNTDPNKEQIIKTLYQAFDEKSNVKMQYEEVLGHAPWKSESNNLLRAITINHNES